MLNNLSIPQEFALLALDRDTNKLKSIFRMYIELYTVMACFVELSIDGKIKFEDNDTITVISLEPTEEKYLDRLLQIVSDEKPKKIKEWTSYFYYNHLSKQKEIYKLVIGSLVDQEVLEIKDSEILNIIPIKKYIDTTNNRNRIVEKIRAELLEAGNLEEHTIALVLLLNSKNMLKDYFSNFEYRALKQRLSTLRDEEIYSKIESFEKAIEDMEIGL